MASSIAKQPVQQCSCCMAYAHTDIYIFNGDPVEREVYRLPDPVGRKIYRLCDICAKTDLSRAIRDGEDLAMRVLFKSIAWIANHIILEMRNNRKAIVREIKNSDWSKWT